MKYGTKPGDHCWVWGWDRSGDMCQRCAHCGRVNARWESLAVDDDDRVQESRRAHAERCPGEPRCSRRRGRW